MRVPLPVGTGSYWPVPIKIILNFFKPNFTINKMSKNYLRTHAWNDHGRVDGYDVSPKPVVTVTSKRPTKQRDAQVIWKKTRQLKLNLSSHK